jgi:DnaD/phage-associated family protein
MASKRMFDKEVINTDGFLDLPMEAKALYFLLGMEADDEGFINPKKVIRLYGGTEDSIKILILKGFIIPFESGVVVITDWKRNNWLDKRRIKETIYLDEKSQINYNEMTNKYEYLASAKQMLRENRIEQNRIVENSIDSSCCYLEQVENELGQLSSMQVEELYKLKDDYGESLVLEAVKECAINNVRTIKYLKGILNNWKKENITTIDDLQKLKQKDPEEQPIELFDYDWTNDTETI